MSSVRNTIWNYSDLPKNVRSFIIKTLKYIFTVFMIFMLQQKSNFICIITYICINVGMYIRCIDIVNLESPKN